MSDPVHNFEFILKKHCSRTSTALYNNRTHSNKPTLKPKDVISGVFSQLKAIQTADVSKHVKRTTKDLTKYKKSNFLSVNNLPVYEEQQKITTKFDTQCVTDTQLINIIENAEILDVHKGMTQEFEIPFCQINTEQVENESDRIKTVIEKDNVERKSKYEEDVEEDISHNIDIVEEVDRERDKFGLSKNGDHKDDIVELRGKINCVNKTCDIDNENKFIDLEPTESVQEDNVQFEQFSQILKPRSIKTEIDKKKLKGKLVIESKILTEVEQCSQLFDTNTDTNVYDDFNCIKNVLEDNYTQMEEDSQLLNQCIEIHDDDNTERPTSPIFINRNVKTISKSLSPLVFNLDKFEQFESVAISLLESNDFETAKHVINSQILDKELHIKMNEHVELNDKEMQTHVSSIITSNADIERITIGDATSEAILDQLTKEDDKCKAGNSTDILKDEILFSSDEEEDSVPKELQDLPFTCALKTSFYDKSDVLDKTMYVGFQTASNRSIQICTGSFIKAKSILNNVTSDDITVSELVKNCDLKDADKEEAVDIVLNDKQLYSDSNKGEKSESQTKIASVSDSKKTPENINFMGFVTANNKKINLSEQALARCKKVFQDIDLNDNFDMVNEKVNLAENYINCNENKYAKFEKEENLVDDVLQGIDDELIQGFENIEMSLQDDEQTDRSKAFFKNKTVVNEEDKITDEFLEDFKENKHDVKETTASQIIGGIQSNDVSYINVGFKTASNKNINISKEAWVKSSNVFENIDRVEFPNKTGKDVNKIKSDDPDHVKGFNIAKESDSNDISKPITDQHNNIASKDTSAIKILDINQPSTTSGFVGFKTASNNNIKISHKAWSKTKNIFNDIDSIELPMKGNKVETEITNSKYCITDRVDLAITPENHFLGFKTANNKNIKISKEALAKTKNIFNDLDSTDLLIPQEVPKDIPEIKMANKIAMKPMIKDEVSKISERASDIGSEFPKNMSGKDLEYVNTGFVGFKTANNKDIRISADALARTKNIFNDIDATDFKLPEKGQSDYPNFAEKHDMTKHNEPFLKNTHEIDTNFEIAKNHDVSESKFLGFKTASNKHVKISADALIKSRNIFKDIDNDINVDANKLSKENKLYTDEIIGKVDDVNTRANSPVFKGFQTANKNPVTVSTVALEKSKKLFEDLDKQKNEEIPAEAKFCGFSTASSKPVKISKEALVKSRKIFNDIDSNYAIGPKNKKKSLYPDEILQENDALRYSSDVLRDKENETAKPIYKGFHTANHKAVAVSKQALEHSKKIFQDVDEIPLDKSKFSIFQTANNKVVNISEKALTESKKLFDDSLSKCQSLKGFQTASNKKVAISEEALAKTKKIFQDIDTSGDKLKDIETNKHKNFNNVFQTGNNKPIVVSDEALARTKRLFSEIDDENKAISNKKDKKATKNSLNKNELDIHAIIDTQVLNNFEESLHTEDFHDTPEKSKRSGSPILSCPRAKKRKKFETPYNIKSILKPIAKAIEIPKDKNKITFKDNYKKDKKYTLKDLENITKDITHSIDPYVLNFNYDNVLQFEFKANRNELSQTDLNIDLLKEYFLDSVNSKLVPHGWLDNHIKLIILKLIYYEVKFKSVIRCTVGNVIDQLKFRYDKELFNAQRPALRKIFEKDDIPSKTIILRVLGIYEDGVKVSSISNQTSKVELLLTDGWYTIRCIIDKMLTELVCIKKITVGTKIVTSGAEISGCEQGVSPWEDTSAVRLKIFGNSTRRAHWDARLGYHGNGAILSHLSSVKVLGGKVSKLRVFVTRVYPALYVEKFEDGSTVTRSERLENLHQVKAEADRQAFMEKLYEEVEREFADQESQDSEGLSDSYKRSGMDSGSQISKLMKKSKDPAEFRAQLTNSQAQLLEAHTSKKRDLLLQEIQTRVRDRIEKAGVCVNRNVVSLLKIRVAGVQEKNGEVQITKGMMSIWKPNDDIREIIKEGAWINVMNVLPTAVRYTEIQISAGRQSIFSSLNYKEPEMFKPYTKLLKRQCYTIKDLAQKPSMTTDYNEIDTVGLIFLIDPSIQDFDSTKQSFQNVYLTDADKNIICINFWGGLKKFGFQNALDTGQVVACGNLQKRAGNTRKSIPQYRVTEYSYITQTPKNENARKMLDILNKIIVSLDRRKFCQDCVILKNNYSVIKQNCENVSPYRFMNSDMNNSKNKMFIDSPLVRQNTIDDNFNLTGLDFESTFKQDTEMTEEMLARKRKVNQKIAKLKMYGEPPPLSPIHIINKSKLACSSYKSPLASNNNNSNIINPNKKQCLSENSNFKNQNLSNAKSDSLHNVASVKNTPEKCGKIACEVNSPVLNRTYVKSVNPVKINFDVKDINDSNIDHFAEEFDGSPPLSLD